MALTLPPDWPGRWVGIPQRDLGRDRSGADCWGLVAIAYAEVAGIALPSYVGTYVSADEHADTAALIAGEREAGPWRQVDPEQAQALDVVLLRHGRYASHVGLVVAAGRTAMLHMGDMASQIVDWSAPVWVRRMEGIWRHADL